jgi:DNA invertase Pin-like site-specific DNA recombinase
VTIDRDQGQSGASAADREGFQHLVAEVGMGRAGIVLGLEVSRLARNNADWHRLLEICALADTLICDEDGLYDPADFNDRLLLGLKGTMSEAELHFIRARLRGGQLSKARRGELPMPLPVGLVYDPAGDVVLDPDAGVQHAIRHLFATFARTHSARAVVQAFAAEGLLFPTRVRTGPHKGELAWMPLKHWRVLRTLQTPRYAGAFVYGRRRERKSPDGKTWRGSRESHAPGGRHLHSSCSYQHTLRALGDAPSEHRSMKARRLWVRLDDLSNGHVCSSLTLPPIVVPPSARPAPPARRAGRMECLY